MLKKIYRIFGSIFYYLKIRYFCLTCVIKSDFPLNPVPHKSTFTIGTDFNSFLIRVSFSFTVLMKESSCVSIE